MPLASLSIQEIEYIKVAIALLVLLYASILDIKYRAIDDKSWLGLVVSGLFLSLAEFYITGQASILKHWGLSLFSALALALILSYSGAMGAGDSGILLGIASMFPLYPFPATSLFPLFFLSVFVNAIFFSLAIPLALFFRNLPRLKEINRAREILLLFIAYRKREEEVKEFEAVLGEGKEFKLFQHVEKVELGKKGGSDQEVWVTPALPFLVPITMGFLLSLSLGDLATMLVLYIF